MSSDSGNSLESVEKNSSREQRFPSEVAIGGDSNTPVGKGKKLKHPYTESFSKIMSRSFTNKKSSDPIMKYKAPNRKKNAQLNN